VTYAGGADGDGTVYEIRHVKGTYSRSPIVLASFTNTNLPLWGVGLAIDRAGDLFGTTFYSGAYNEGSVFEIAKTGGSYATSPITLASFNGSDGAGPPQGLVMNRAGDLFGTTFFGGADSDGAVFEIVKTDGAYASTPTLLASFNGTDGETPVAGLTIDAKGNLFGETESGGAKGDGTIFEIKKTTEGYSSTPIAVASFSTASGYSPEGGLNADSAGNLFGTTYVGGSGGDGTIFEVSGSLFHPPTSASTDGTLDLTVPLGYTGSHIEDFATTSDQVDLAGSWSFLKFHENKTGTLGTLTNGTNDLAHNFVGDFIKSDSHIVTGATTVITHT
jgi:uncharacterized repeat protein (TIGR03803 family)